MRSEIDDLWEAEFWPEIQSLAEEIDVDLTPPRRTTTPTKNPEGQTQSGESQDSNTGDENPPAGPKIDTSALPEPPIQSPQQDKVEEPEEVPLIIKILKRIFG